MVYDNDHYHASALLHNKKKGAADVTWKLTGCSNWRAYCQHPALHPSRHVEPLSLNDRFHLYPQRAYYLLTPSAATETAESEEAWMKEKPGTLLSRKQPITTLPLSSLYRKLIRMLACSKPALRVAH
ncbi:hypothetical protein T05_9641 [Trichinella murrelli]|uniref:Uncharacterized protein n=1 Tax=Trichinella murrelli TaxID=144512 RepID=A0A0V0TTQ1_9BILA|nr:hypothetical protein T05_9641 [Trichinella murrelli]